MAWPTMESRASFLGILVEIRVLVAKNWRAFAALWLLVVVLPYALFGMLMAAVSTDQTLMIWSALYREHLHKLFDVHGVHEGQQEVDARASFRMSYLVLAGVADFAFVLTQAFISVPALTQSIYRAACLEDRSSLGVRASLPAIPRAARPVALTLLCQALTYLALALLVGLPSLAVSALLHLQPRTYILIATLCAAAGSVYLASVVWWLTAPVVILDGRHGWDALARSASLIKGHRLVAFGLLLFFIVLSAVPAIAFPGGVPSPTLWTIVADVATVAWLSFIFFYMIAAKALLFIACKAYHHEPLDTLLISTSTQFTHHPTESFKFVST